MVEQLPVDMDITVDIIPRMERKPDSKKRMQLHIVKQLIIIYTMMDSEDCKPGRFI